MNSLLEEVVTLQSWSCVVCGGSGSAEIQGREIRKCHVCAGIKQRLEVITHDITDSWNYSSPSQAVASLERFDGDYRLLMRWLPGMKSFHPSMTSHPALQRFLFWLRRDGVWKENEIPSDADIRAELIMNPSSILHKFLSGDFIRMCNSRRVTIKFNPSEEISYLVFDDDTVTKFESFLGSGVLIYLARRILEFDTGKIHYPGKISGKEFLAQTFREFEEEVSGRITAPETGKPRETFVVAKELYLI